MKRAPMARLRDFFGAYFHEDWADGTTDYLKVVDEYIAAWRDVPVEIRKLGEALQALSESSEDDSALETLLTTKLGSSFAPSRWGLSARAWVLILATHVKAAL